LPPQPGVIAVGASAGGIDALQRLIRALPEGLAAIDGEPVRAAAEAS
jgi:chemotaxis response regulator CheB